jgi:hypothetical protein
MGAELMKHYLAGGIDRERMVAEAASMMLAGEAYHLPPLGRAEPAVVAQVLPRVLRH